MKSNYVIQEAVLSEKAYQLMDRGVYTFLVDPKAKKKDIAQAIKNQFTVDVIRVNLGNLPSKTRRVGSIRKTVRTGGGRKAIIWLKKGQSIAKLHPKTTESAKKPKKEKEVEKASPEGKEG